MFKEENRLIRKVEFFCDLSTTAIAFFIAFSVQSTATLALEPLSSLPSYLYLLYIIIPLWAILLHYHGTYHSVRTSTFIQAMAPIFKTVTTGGLILTAILFSIQFTAINRTFLFLTINMSLLILERATLFYFLHYIRKHDRNFRTLIIAGTGPRALRFAKCVIDHKAWGLKIGGFVDLDPALVGKEVLGHKVIGCLKDVPDIIVRKQIDEVVFVGPRSWFGHQDQIAAIEACENVGIRVRVVCDFFTSNITQTTLDMLTSWPLLTITPPPHYGEMFMVKRLIDISLSTFALLLLSPVLIICALAVKFTSPGGVLFRQERCGLNGRRFDVLKFRTMVQNADAAKAGLQHLNESSGPVFKIKKDPRLTKVGRVLRKYSLDEFPQFINVLFGDMSIVGPRPPTPDEVEKYKISQRRRLSVRPGITCLWQVSGRNNIGFEEWMALDLQYIDEWSLSLDMRIIALTVPAVLKGTGV